jgi:glycosyltransferase involved in cell wall biosynthesis
MRILFVSHTDPFGPFRIGSHHLAAGLARAGHDVTHLSTPISLAHLASRRISRAKAAATPADSIGADGVRYLVPRTVLPAGVGRFRVARHLARLGLARFDLVLVDQPLLWSPSLRGIADRLVYRPTDEYPDGLKARLQRGILNHADGVIATSGEVLRRLGPLTVPSIVIVNGVDVERFRFSGGGPRGNVCVYVGAFDARFDWTQTIAWAAEHPTWRFVLAGPAGTPPSPPPANVELLGAVPYDELPAVLAEARVGLLPLSDDPLNRGRSPMKLYEYLASGLATVSRETAVIHSDAAAGVYTYEDASGAAEALHDAMRHPSPNSAGAHRASSESWTAKCGVLLEFAASLP